MNYDRAAMKREIRQAMKQARPHPMLVTLLFLMIVSAVAGMISSGVNMLFSGAGAGMPADELLAGMLTEGPDYFLTYFTPEALARMMVRTVLASFALSVLITIWNGLMNAGYAGYCLDMAQGSNPELGRIFGGFSRAGAVIPACLLAAVFTFLWNLLFGFAYGVVIGILGTLSGNFPDIALVFALLMLAATAGYIFAIVWVVFRYAMVPYAVMDSRNNLSGLAAVRTSKTLMKGRKGRFFVLQLSFIGWYLLQCLVVVAGVMLAVIAAAVTVSGYAGQIDQLMSFADTYGSEILFPILLPVLFPMLADYYGDLSWITEYLNYDAAWVTAMIGQFTLWILLITLLCGAAIFVINLWLTPYRTGSNARFYVHAAGGQALQPGPQGSQPGQFGPTGVQPGSYGVQPDPTYGVQPPVPPYGGQPVSDGQPGPYGVQPGPTYGVQPPVPPYGGQPVSDGQPGSYGVQPGPTYGVQPPVPPYGGQPVSDGQPGSYGVQPEPTYGVQPPVPPYGGQPVSDGQPGSYGVQFGPTYGGQSGPYGYTPPGQSSFGGAAQGPQFPQYGGSGYPQWGAPQPPQAPSLSETEYPAPAAPAVPEAPVTPGTPAAPEIPVAPEATTILFGEGPDDPDPMSKPTVIFGAPDDDAPQPPSGPNYPQY